MADYDGGGTSTVTGTWNALEIDIASHTGMTGELGATSVNVAIQTGVSNVAAPGTNNTAHKSGLTLYAEAQQLGLVTVSNINSFSSQYDAILYMSFGAGATSGSITVNGAETSLTGPASGGDTNQTFIITGLTADTLTIDMANTTLAGTGTAVVFGGMQIVAVPEPSTFALLGGILALGLVAVRRWKR
jgi:hypothetical protein